jgi:hypothetical protein
MHWRNNHLLILLRNRSDTKSPFAFVPRVIQEHIKKTLADEVLFGRLKTGGHVGVVVVIDEAGNSKLRPLSAPPADPMTVCPLILAI